MEKTIALQTQQAIKDQIFPGCVVGLVTSDGRKQVWSFGNFTYDTGSPVVKIDSIFDVASITKVIPTASLLMKYIDEGRAAFDDPVVKYLPEFGNIASKKSVTLRHLLTYTVDFAQRPLSAYKDRSADEILSRIIRPPLASPPGQTKFLYVNSTAALTGLVVTKIGGNTLDKLAEQHFFQPLKMSRTTFHPEKFSKQDFVPTEVDAWRDRVIQGEIHDESSYVLRQKLVVGIAGLFTTVPDSLNYVEMLLNLGKINGNRFFSESMVKQMYTNQLSNLNEYMGFGWDIFRPEELPKGVPATSMYKTGFTGCLVAADVPSGVGVVVFTNRTYPHRSNPKPVQNYRRKILEVIFGNL